ncbi:MAG: baseplate J/gp47 family protein [Eubacteriales bacterium]|nr:baseplate J/gp47 family protein [Eubacteriales bacterium]
MQDNSFEAIMTRALARVPADMDKREGSLIYDALAPLALELEMVYIELENNEKESFADTASREYLIKRAKERGLKPYQASHAVLKISILPAMLELALGTRFNSQGANYIVIEKINAGQYKIKCEEPGVIGNRLNIDLIPMEYIENLESIIISELLIPAEDEEPTEDFRKRYFDSFGSQAFGGNIQDYKEKTRAISGVSGVKVTPNHEGAGTVKLTIISSNYDVPSSELIQQVQEKIDPQENAGKGYGLAPIGHRVTVQGVTSQAVNIQTTITYQSGWNYEAGRTYIETTIDDYFLELAKNWENETQLVIRISQIETRILNAQGVLDIQNTRLNGQASNLTLAEMQIPKRGSING